MTKVARAVAIASLAGLIVACQTQKAATILDPPEPNAIKASSPGFSPTGEEATRNMRLALLFGNKTLPQSWSVEIATGSVVVKRFEGSGSGDQLPSEVVWDGRTESGAVWPEGEYYAILSSTYGGVYNPSRAVWDKFYLASSAPSVALSADPSEFTPEGQSMAAPVTIAIVSKAPLAAISSWQVSVRDGSDTVVKSFSGDGASAKAVWDGSIEPSGYAEPSKSYTADGRGPRRVRQCRPRLPADSRPRAGERLPRRASSRPRAAASRRRATRTAAASTFPSSTATARPCAPGGWRSRALASSAGLSRDGPKSAPATLAWDGRDNQGALCPEGELLGRARRRLRADLQGRPWPGARTSSSASRRPTAVSRPLPPPSSLRRRAFPRLWPSFSTLRPTWAGSIPGPSTSSTPRARRSASSA